MTIFRSPWLYVIVFILCMVGAACSIAQSKEKEKEAPTGKTYYVDSKGGNDANNGLSTKKAWKSLAKVNKTTFKPGDTILFKSGGVWTGQLYPKGSGQAGKPITIGKYGTGNKPRIQGGGRVNAVYLFNQEYWDIGHLEITNYSSAQAKAPRRGIEIVGENYKAGAKTDLAHVSVLHEIRLHDLYIHQINGEDKKDGKGSGGIHITINPGTGPVKRVTKFDGIYIENNVIENVHRTGIMTNSSWNSRKQVEGDAADPTRPWIPHSNVVIRGNTLSGIGGDGIVPHNTTGAIVERNKLKGYNTQSAGYNAGMWTYNGDYTLYQYNEVSGGVSTRDGMPFDFDHGSKGIVYQYNYSYDNEGGALLICADGSKPGSGIYDGVFRYNVSQNDRYQLISNCTGSNAYNIQIYNNVFYVAPGIKTDMLMHEGGTTEVSVSNNIFYNLGSGGYRGKPGWTYSNNVFFGSRAPTPEVIPDATMKVEDPLFVFPGIATGIDDLAGYQLREGSPALASGMRVAASPLKDAWGVLADQEGAVNIGAYNGPGKTGVPLIVNGDFEHEMLPWTSWGEAAIVKGNEARGGSNAAKVQANSAFEQVVSVKPNTDYVLNAYVKVANEGEGVNLGVKNYDDTSQQSSVRITGTQYALQTVSFTTGANSRSVKIYLYNDSASGYAVGDDFELVEAAAAENQSSP